MNEAASSAGVVESRNVRYCKLQLLIVLSICLLNCEGFFYRLFFLSFLLSLPSLKNAPHASPGGGTVLTPFPLTVDISYYLSLTLLLSTSLIPLKDDSLASALGDRLELEASALSFSLVRTGCQATCQIAGWKSALLSIFCDYHSQLYNLIHQSK